MSNKKNSNYFSASELNKFTYCNYSWYYERIKLKPKYNKKYTNNNSQIKQNFKKGINFHKDYYQNNKKNKINNMAISFFLVLLAIVLFYMVMYVR